MNTSRRPLIAGNWKMHGTVAESASLAHSLKKRLSSGVDVDVLIIPPFTALAAVHQVVQHSEIRLGAQNVHPEPKGAFTGEVSTSMLKDVGCTAVLVGHSERRHVFGEDDAFIGRKVLACLNAGLTPILCLGETLAERDRGDTLEVVQRQLQAGLAGLTVEQVLGVVLAYEPVWAIGTGQTATAEQAQEVHAWLRARVGTSFPAPVSHTVRVLYGGSVKAENSLSLLAQPDIDGLLVGGASLQVDEFERIVRSRKQWV